MRVLCERETILQSCASARNNRRLQRVERKLRGVREESSPPLQKVLFSLEFGFSYDREAWSQGERMRGFKEPKMLRGFVEEIASTYNILAYSSSNNDPGSTLTLMCVPRRWTSRPLSWRERGRSYVEEKPFCRMQKSKHSRRSWVTLPIYTCVLD